MGLRDTPEFELFYETDQKGGWNKDQLVDMVNNAEILKQAKVHVPPIAIGHDEQQPKTGLNGSGAPSFGLMPNIRLGSKLIKGQPVSTLVAGGKEVPDFLAGLLHKGAYRRISVEAYPADRIPKEFQLPGVKGPVLKRVSFIGSDMPALKNIKDVAEIYRREVPAVTFTESAPVEMEIVKQSQRIDRDGTVICFTECQPMQQQPPAQQAQQQQTPTMDRAGMLQALGQCGVNITLATDGTPDNFLADVLRVLQAKPQTPAPNNAGNPGNTAMSFTETDPKKIAEQALKNSQDALKFSEETRESAKREMIVGKVKHWSSIGVGKVTPAEIEAGLIDRLMACDDQTAVKFGEKEMTPLAQAFAEIEARPAHKLSEVSKGGTPVDENAEVAKVVKFCEDQELPDEQTQKYVEAFKAKIKTDPKYTAEKYGIRGV